MEAWGRGGGVLQVVELQIFLKSKNISSDVIST